MILAHALQERTASVRGQSTVIVYKERDPALQVSVAEYPVARMGSVKEEMLSVHGTQSKGPICILTQHIWGGISYVMDFVYSSSADSVELCDITLVCIMSFLRSLCFMTVVTPSFSPGSLHPFAYVDLTSLTDMGCVNKILQLKHLNPILSRKVILFSDSSKWSWLVVLVAFIQKFQAIVGTDTSIFLSAWRMQGCCVLAGQSWDLSCKWNKSCVPLLMDLIS